MGNKYDYIHPEPNESSQEYIRRAMEETQRRSEAPPVVGREPDSQGCSCSKRCNH